jgi:RNA polymerase sigma-70 factor (ECF subfamily)
MATISTKRLITHDSREARSASPDGPGDDELLDRFLGGHGHASAEAFRALVLRHGPMVMGVCRHVLRLEQDSEDAFQATFLALARKGDTIRNQRVLAGWLHEVAYRIAIRSRANTSRRRDQERQGASMSPVSTTPDHENQVAWSELRPVLHEEVNQLPEKYRLPIIMSYLEGKSNEEVAGVLGWPVGTVKGRLSRARDLLRSRLNRRGLALSAAFICMALSQDCVLAEAVPASLIDRTLEGAMRARCGLGAGIHESPAGPAAESLSGPARVEQYARLAFEGGLGTSRVRTGLFVLIAVLGVGSAIASFVFNEDRARARISTLTKSISATLLGPSEPRSCH